MFTDTSWRKLLAAALQIDASPFARELARRKAELGIQGAMSRFDAAVIYALVAHCKPRNVVEVGTYAGMSTAYILRALAHSETTDGVCYSVDTSSAESVASLVPNSLRGGLRLVTGDVTKLVDTDQLPASIDFFLHDSTHRYSHQMWEFQEFWSRLASGGVLASHDVDLNASFVDFISSTYAHDSKGKLIPEKRGHVVWGRLGLVGFLIKA